MLVMISLPPPRDQRQQSVNDICCCILNTVRAIERRYPIINLSAAFMRITACVNIATTF